jgi:hypothetical protein
MRRARKWWLAGLVLGAIGCANREYSDLRPNRPEEYKLPPDGMYTGDVTYPKETLNQFSPRKDKDSLDAPAPAQSGRMPGGMGGAMGARP